MTHGKPCELHMESHGCDTWQAMCPLACLHKTHGKSFVWHMASLVSTCMEGASSVNRSQTIYRRGMREQERKREREERQREREERREKERRKEKKNEEKEKEEKERKECRAMSRPER